MDRPETHKSHPENTIHFHLGIEVLSVLMKQNGSRVSAFRSRSDTSLPPPSAAPRSNLNTLYCYVRVEISHRGGVAVGWGKLFPW